MLVVGTGDGVAATGEQHKEVLELALHGLVDLVLDDRADRGLELVHVVEQAREVILFEQPVDAGSVVSLQSTLPIPGMWVTRPFLPSVNCQMAGGSGHARGRPGGLT